MKRTPLKRKTRLKVKGKSRFPKRRNDAYRKWIREMPCWVGWYCDRSAAPACLYEAECAHVIPKGRGSDDVGNCVPLCAAHHREQEGRTARFEAKYHIDLASIAERLAGRWREQQGAA